MHLQSLQTWIITEWYFDIFETRYQNIPIEWRKWHLSQVIGWFLARAIGKYFLTGPFGHTVCSLSSDQKYVRGHGKDCRKYREHQQWDRKAAATIEICWRFYLRPLHTLSWLIRDVVREHSKDFFRKSVPRGLATKISVLSAAVMTYRRKEENSSHVPYVIYK